MQAIVERALRQGIHKVEHSQINVNATCFSSHDYGFLQEVISGASEILKIATSMALAGTLRCMPARQSLCIISAAIFLLKALSIGSWNVQVQPPLEVLDQCMAAIRSSPIDDMDFSSRFASLIEKRVAAFRASFGLSREASTCDRSCDGFDEAPARGLPNDGTMAPSQISRPPNSSTDIARDSSLSADSEDLSPYTMDWWDRPFDPSVAPFSSTGNHISSGLELDSLDFLWNIPELPEA